MVGSHTQDSTLLEKVSDGHFIPVSVGPQTLNMKKSQDGPKTFGLCRSLVESAL